MKFIGLSGVAGSGKDLFYSFLSERINCTKFSLADELKRELSPWCNEHYGIDPVSCTRQDKEIIRPFLVFHGANKRKRSKGRHWINKLQQYISNFNHGDFGDTEYGVITDIRYDDYNNDEVSWLQNELKGVLIHITQYKKENSIRVTRKPANSEEARNEPKLIKKADFNIEWDWVEKGQINLLKPHIDQFLEWHVINEHEKIHNRNRRLIPSKKNKEERMQ